MTANVLVVDDSLTVRMDLAEGLAAAGIGTVLCASLAEARVALARERVDLAILDVLLPDGNGVELLEELRSAASGRIPVLMLSTEAEVRDRVRGLQSGADEYVGKPYDTPFVAARARELLGLGRSAPSERVTVLVIDDSPTFRHELQGALEAAGYATWGAASGEEGLRVAAERTPDVLVVDGQLPGIDGAAVIRRVRLDSALRRAACLLLTASGDRGAELAALDAGADAFIRKEDGLDLILARLSATVRRGRGAAEGTVSMLGRRILAVDDSLTFLNEVAEMLRDEGYEVILARSGEDALELLAVQPVDCILLDLMMPGMGGHEACRRIKAAPGTRDIPLVMLTALDERETMIQSLGAGADDYISKGGEFTVLKARVRAQLRRKQFEDDNRRIREQLLRTEIDATEARAARELAETRAGLVEQLERKNKELEAFSYSVSHDLRAPLRSIDGFSQALLEDYGAKLDERGQRYLTRVRAAAQRMGQLIDDLLDLSRVDRAELARQRVDLAAIARDVVADLRRENRDRVVEVVIPDGLFAAADPRLMRVVFDNLLGNAWKFTAKTANARVEVAMERVGGVDTWVVRDNGAGFDMAYVEKLFAPFQRLHRADDFAGTGIGLATVQRVVARHGGRVWAEGRPGAGATFFFTLPATTSYSRAQESP